MEPRGVGTVADLHDLARLVHHRRVPGGGVKHPPRARVAGAHRGVPGSVAVDGDGEDVAGVLPFERLADRDGDATGPERGDEGGARAARRVTADVESQALLEPGRGVVDRAGDELRLGGRFALSLTPKSGAVNEPSTRPTATG